ncbi:MAG: aminotransferase class I/II-fold pyridoxal phosphate-dependent enzyme [Nannocystaceae bacterium]
MSNSRSRQPLSLHTRAVHTQAAGPRIEGAAVTPIFMCTVFETDPAHPDSPDSPIRYPRLSNLPNHELVHRKLCDLEGGDAAIVTASGMAAISTAVLALAADAHILVQDTLYGGTHGFFVQHAADLGVSWDFIDADKPNTWRKKLRPDTRAIYTETLSNPLLEVADHRAIVAFAREHGLVSMVDNTLASPVNFRPPELGYDVSVHSATKYLNGHSDLLAGACIGRSEPLQRIRRRLEFLGGTLDPHACFLLDRGIKTLPLRMAQHNANGMAVATFLADHPTVARVHYPGLPTHPHHQRARDLFLACGGVVSLDLKAGRPAAQRLMRRLHLFAPTPSLGGVESLITIPATTSHRNLTSPQREQVGVGPGLVRLALGIEAAEDLIADLDQALCAD